MLQDFTLFTPISCLTSPVVTYSQTLNSDFEKLCELQLIEVSHDLAYSLNNKSQTDIVLLNFSKTFKVLHHLLLTKLQHYGIRGNVLNWISDFFSIAHSTCHTICGGSSCKPIKVTSGVPQGSVLGPLLFLAYINDITDNLSSLCHLFADDCILYRDIKSAEDAQILQEDLDKLAIGAKTWGMQFNIDKC